MGKSGGFLEIKRKEKELAPVTPSDVQPGFNPGIILAECAHS